MTNRHPSDPDRALESPASQAMRELVRSLPDDEPSMLWRSELNERVLALARMRQRKRRWTWVMAPTAGVAATVAFLGLVIAPKGVPTPSVAQTGAVERMIVDTHLSGSTAGEISSFGFYASMVHGMSTATAPTDLHDWTEVDLEAL